jgi:hypothetical protein
MTTKTPHQYATTLLDRLIDLDDLVTGAFYEMGQILSAIEHGKLWDVLGYESFAHLIEEEMSFTSGTAGKYYHTYRHFKRLHYTKVEAIALIREFSFTRIAEYIPNATVKVGRRAIRNKIDELLANKRQINFTVNADEYEMISRVFKAHGAEISDNGRWMHSTEAFVTTMREADRPKLKAVS